ncbi:hypothetical protein [Halapricum desulfuricans]|uniref:Uncharacterized protein n=1 Tax=Halapricum desulfuricans TaxID=2841257 RepID=A0A897NZG0_9EURY|nr:hypothetical protein [Halapricum desulfuricans]QSG16093.1 hypothetical protein HSEST_2583 [Halapricum desulfuricans]
MADVSLDLDAAMIDNLRREADEHGFDDIDGYVEWLLGHRDTVLGEHDVWDEPPGVDPDADLGQSSGPSLDPGRSGEASLESDSTPSAADAASDAEPSESDADDTASSDSDGESPEDGADDDDVAAALEEIEFDDETE